MRGTKVGSEQLLADPASHGPWLRLLLPGDAEVEEQQSVLAAGVDVSADVLKVPPPRQRLLRSAVPAGGTRPSWPSSSVGRHNDYGHPSPLLLAELGQLGLPVRRTDQDAMWPSSTMALMR